MSHEGAVELHSHLSLVGTIPLHWPAKLPRWSSLPLVEHTIQVWDPDSDLPPTAAGGFHVHGIERPGPSVGGTSTWCRLYYLQLRKYKLLELQLWGHEIPACSIWLRTSPTLVIENLEVKTCKSKQVPRWFSDLQSQRLTTDCDKATLSFKISMMRTVLSFKPQWSCTLFHCRPRFRHVLYWESLPKWEGLGNDPDAFLASSSALRMAATWKLEAKEPSAQILDGL